MILVTATAGSDYMEASSPLVFPAGSEDGALACAINIIDDSALEDEEAFTVTLSTMETYVMLGNNQTDITISDNDSKR